MKCPVCGAWNRASLPRCQKCGADLTDAEPQSPSWQQQFDGSSAGKSYIRVNEYGEETGQRDARDVLAGEMAELKERKTEGTRLQRRLRQESAKRGAAPSTMTIRTHASVDTFWNLEDDPRTTVRMRGKKPRDDSRTKVSWAEEPEHETPSRNITWEDAPINDSLWTDRPTYDSHYPLPGAMDFTGRFPSRARSLRRFVYGLLITLLVCMTALCVFFGVQWFQSRATAQTAKNNALVTASIKNDLAAHTILIPGEDGQQIYIRELHTTYIVTEGFATVEVEDHVWYDDIEDFMSETLDVTLTPFMKTASGQQKPLNPIHYVVDVPLSPITLNTPDSTRQEVVTGMYSISFEVRPGSKVYINGSDVSDTVDSITGACTYNASVQPIGDNHFNIRVRSQYCRENTLTLVLYREVQEIPLDLAAETYTTTTLRSLKIKATTLPGAVVDVLSPSSDLDITELNSTGEFSFYAVFDRIGNNTITITASYPGKKTSVVNYVINYVPPIDQYSARAWPTTPAADYSELVSNINARAANQQVYVVMAKLDHLLSTKPQIGVFYTGVDGISQPVVVENCTQRAWEAGTYYRIYADVDSSYNGMPRLNCRYFYLN